MSYLEFDRDFTYTGKTKVFKVKNIDGHQLGEIRWWAPWRRYTFNPNNYTKYDAECLRDITEFINQLMEERKDGQSK